MNGDSDVRPARLEDVAAIVALQRLIHAEHVAADALRWTTATPPHAVYAAWIGDLLSRPADGMALVATDADGAVVGYLVAEVEPESTRHWSPLSLYLHDVFVLPEHRGAGVARRLIESMFAWRDARHATLPVRLTTGAHNDAARTFFARFGFRASTVEMIEDKSSV